MNLLQSKINHILLAVLISTLVSCGAGKNGHVQEVQSYLDEYNKKYQELYSASTDGQWAVNTHIVEGDTMNAFKSGLADQALAKFTGSNVNIEKARAYMKWENELQPLQIKQLKKILYMAAGGPESAEKEVKALIKAGTAQTEKLYGYKFQMDGKEITPNDIDSLLSHATDTAIRRKAWEASKAIGKEMKPGLINLRELRNKVVQGLGYPDYFTYMVSDYGMTKDEMMAMLKKFNKELFPLYNELHTYMRYE